MIQTSFLNIPAPAKQWCRIVGGCVLGSCFGLILTSPTQQMRQVEINCPDTRVPSTLVTGAEQQISSGCLVVQSVTRQSALWVY